MQLVFSKVLIIFPCPRFLFFYFFRLKNRYVRLISFDCLRLPPLRQPGAYRRLNGNPDARRQYKKGPQELRGGYFLFFSFLFFHLKQTLKLYFSEC